MYSEHVNSGCTPCWIEWMQCKLDELS